MNKTVTTLAAAGLLLSAQAAWAQATVNVAHFAPFADSIDATAVDIAIDGEVALPGVKYKDFVTDLSFEAGTYTIEVFPVGSDTAVMSEMVTLVDGRAYTLYASGNNVTQPLALVAMQDNIDAPLEGELNLRIVHAAPFAADLAATEVSIRTAGGDVVGSLTGVPYGVNSGFFPVPAAEYDLKVASNDGSVNYIDLLPVELPAGADITVFAVGDGVNQPLGIVAIPVGELPTRTPVDNRSNGMWMIQEGSGTGYVFQPMPSQNRVVGTWYTYDADGNPTFLTFDSCDVIPGDPDDVCNNPGGFDGEMATTALYTSSGGGPNEDDVVTTTKVGEIDFEILSCNDATATVRLDGADPVTYTASQLSRPFPCVDTQ